MPNTPIKYASKYQRLLEARAQRNGTSRDYEASMIVQQRANSIVMFALAPSRPSAHLPVED